MKLSTNYGDNMKKTKKQKSAFQQTAIYRVLIRIYDAMFAVFLSALKLAKKIIQYFI
jgi:hypothetical protein